MSKTVPTNDDLDLARAKAIGEVLYGYCDPTDTPNTWKIALSLARAIRTADAAMGVVSVPVRATKEMIIAGYEATCGMVELDGYETSGYYVTVDPGVANHVIRA